MAEDWLKLYRRLKDSDLWLAEPFTRGQAWLDLLMLAKWKAGYVRIRGIRVDLEPGQLAWSEVELAKRWQWGRKKVRRFLQELEHEGQQIEQQKNNVTTIIYIKNWDKYQAGATAERTADDTASDTANDTAEGTADFYISPVKASFEGPKKGKKGKKEQEEEYSPSYEGEPTTSSDEVVLSSPSSNGSAPLQKIASLWNETLEKYNSALPRLKKIQPNTQRHKHIRARWKEYPDLETWETVFQKVAQSDFLNGRIKRWQASFDWVIGSPDKFLSTLEGKYDNRNPPGHDPKEPIT